MDIATNTTDQIDRTVSSLKDGAATASANLQQAQSAVHEGMHKMMKTTEEMVSFSQGNFEALAKSGQVWMGGMQDLSQSMAAAAKASMEDTVGGFKAMAGVKSFKDLFELQSTMVRMAMERSVAQTRQLAEHGLKLSERTLAPIGARVTAATETFGRIG